MTSNRTAQVEIILFKIIEGNPLFLLLKRNPDRGGFWQPVTGGVEGEEDITLAAKREVEEETGISEFVQFFENIHYFEFVSEGYGPKKEYVFGAEIKPDATITISWEHDEMKWCNLEEALDLLKYETNKEGFRKLFALIS